ncbi:MAG: DUF4974 domain-containing protein, partial [Odoribacteraceae bacterium]|nr:DUF4974 domain-containing protein [Odoribacteraceae bacterium]
RRRRALTTAEEEALSAWLAADERNRETARRLSRFPDLLEGIRFFAATDKEKGWEETRQKINGKWRERRRRRATRVVAVVACLLVAALLLLQREHPRSPGGNDLSLVPTPPRHGALLQLSGGEIISLEGVSAVKEEDGTVVASHDSITGLAYRAGGEGQEALRHVVIAPRGTECKLTLSDGTIVWLNSGSRLTYPVAFPPGARVIEMTGEAYMEVASRESSPFIIRSGELEVEVTGTAFNLEAYPDEETARVTLVSGSLDVRVPGEGAIARLTPRHQAVYSRPARRLERVEVDPYPFVAWRSGEIYLDGERLEEITRRLERWYDVTFAYDAPGTRELHFRGKIRRHEHVSRVLAMLELTNLVSFTLADEKTIRVNAR